MLGIMLVADVVIGFQYLASTSSSLYSSAEETFYNNNINLAGIYSTDLDYQFDIFNEKAFDYIDEVHAFQEGGLSLDNEKILNELKDYFYTYHEQVGFTSFAIVDKHLTATDKRRVSIINSEGELSTVQINDASLYPTNPTRFYHPLINFYDVNRAFGSDANLGFEGMGVIYNRPINRPTGGNHDDDTMYLMAFSPATKYLQHIETAYSKYEYKYFIAANDGFIYQTNHEGTDTSLVEILNKANGTSDYQDFIHESVDSHTSLKIGNEKYFVVKSVVSLQETYNDLGINIYTFVTSKSVDSVYSHLFLNAVLVVVTVSLVLLIVATVFALLIWSFFYSYKLTMFELTFSKNYNIIVSRNGDIVFSNHLFKSINSLGSKNVFEFEFFSFERFEPVPKNLKGESLKGNSLVVGLQTKNKLEKDETFTSYIRFTLIHNKKQTQMIGLNCTSFYHEYKKLSRLAYYNTICDVLNQKSLEEKLDEILLDINNYPEMYVAIIDIRDFKNINSLFGYDFGNLIITKFAEILQKVVELFPNDNDILYSLGGDRFAILFSKKDDTADGVAKYCDNIFNSFNDSIEITQNTILLIPNIGVFEIKKNRVGFMSAKSIISDCILANRSAKDINGKHYYLYDVSLSRNAERDMIMQEDLKNALANNEFVTYFQPQYDTQDCKIKGFECLIRWNNPKYRLESPLKYIKIAERIGLIRDIGEFTLIESFKLVKELSAKTKIHVSVNVSPAQLLQAGFLARFVQLYNEYDLKPETIAIEITETYLMSNFQETIARLKYLKEKGIPIYLDDFGTGYSSMLYLNELPIDFIKIDREFIKDIQYSKSSRTIVSKIIGLATELNIGVIAEGVETDYQAAFLLKNGCRLIQGWLVSKALPKNELDKILDFHDDVTVAKK
jgi:diguanylate cyclase (GGDEF)-like protein